MSGAMLLDRMVSGAGCSTAPATHRGVSRLQISYCGAARSRAAFARSSPVTAAAAAAAAGAPAGCSAALRFSGNPRRSLICNSMQGEAPAAGSDDSTTSRRGSASNRRRRQPVALLPPHPQAQASGVVAAAAGVVAAAADTDSSSSSSSSSGSKPFDFSDEELRQLWDSVSRSLLKLGKAGLTPSHTNSLRELLASHTLVKVDLNAAKDEAAVAAAAADMVQQLQGAGALLQVKGRTLLLGSTGSSREELLAVAEASSASTALWRAKRQMQKTEAAAKRAAAGPKS